MIACSDGDLRSLDDGYSERRDRMATMYYDKDADLSLIQGKKVAVIGYGSQGHAHALNLKDSGVSVKVGSAGDQPVARQGAGRRPRGRRGRRRRRSGPTSSWCSCPTPRRPSSTSDAIEPNLAAGNMLMFAHGFNIRFGTITVRAGRRRHDGRAEGAGPPRPRALCRGRRHAGADRRPPGRDRQGARRWRCRTPRASASPAPASSRRRSPKRPRPICSASRRCCAAASAR